MMANQQIPNTLCRNISNTLVNGEKMNLATNIQDDKNGLLTYNDVFLANDGTNFQLSKIETAQDEFSNGQTDESSQISAQVAYPESQIRRESSEQTDRYLAEEVQLTLVKRGEFFDSTNFSIDEIATNEEAVLNGSIYKINVLPNGDIEFLKPSTEEIPNFQNAGAVDSGLKENYSSSPTQVITQLLPVQSEEFKNEPKSFHDQTNVAIQNSDNLCYNVLDEKAFLPMQSELCKMVNRTKPASVENSINKPIGNFSRKVSSLEYDLNVTCKNCRKKMPPSTYDKHLNDCLNRKTQYPCSYQNCGAILASPYNRRRHEKSVHKYQEEGFHIKQHSVPEEYNRNVLVEVKCENLQQDDSSESIDLSFLYENTESSNTKEIKILPKSPVVIDTNEPSQDDSSAVFLYQVVLSADGEPEYFRPLTSGEPEDWQKVFVAVDTMKTCYQNINPQINSCNDPQKVFVAVEDMDSDSQNNNINRLEQNCGGSLTKASGTDEDYLNIFQGCNKIVPGSNFLVSVPVQSGNLVKDENASFEMDNELSEIAKEVSESLVNVAYPNSESGSSVSWPGDGITSDSESATDYSTEGPSSSQKKEKIYQCDFKDCNAFLSSHGNKQRHELFVHQPPVKCPFENCNKLVKPGGLSRHIQRVHSGIKQTIEKNFLCPHENCDIAFATQGCRRKHIRSVHQSPIKCPYHDCNAAVKPASLKRHILGLHGKVKKQCGHCNKSISIYTFYNHIKKCGKNLQN